jgi:hypothetical protein
LKRRPASVGAGIGTVDDKGDDIDIAADDVTLTLC